MSKPGWLLGVSDEGRSPASAWKSSGAFSGGQSVCFGTYEVLYDKLAPRFDKNVNKVLRVEEYGEGLETSGPSNVPHQKSTGSHAVLRSCPVEII
ncbi:hypothetical protein E4U55_005300 [Claviceps digitariae]|nr:hypothetical protein E4U55_005300 [Claviceps digitariae]